MRSFSPSMQGLAVLSVLASISLTAAKPLSFRSLKNDTAHAIAKIDWAPCNFNTSDYPLPDHIDCGSLVVPLDYTDSTSNETLTLSLLRSKAVSPSTGNKKSMLFNFGGPGYEARLTLAAIAPTLHNMTGGEYDLVAFDPRGTADTITFKCFANPTDRTVATTTLTIHDLDPGASSPNAFAENYANAVAFSQRCDAYNLDPGLRKKAEVLTTGMVARDLMAVVDSLHAHEGEDGLLHYWGISYGSLLGETVAALFPDRMERLVLDGVVNAENYYHRFGIDVDQLLTSDPAFRGVLDDCLKVGASRCALADLNSTASELEDTLLEMVERYQVNPVAAAGKVINGRFVKELLIITIKYPVAVVPRATVLIRSLLEGENLEAVVAYYDAFYASLDMGDNDALAGIACSDKVVRATGPKDQQLIEDTEYMRNTSQLFGGLLAGIATQCAEWPFEGKGKYVEHWFDEQGQPKVIKTRKPVLFIGNRYDPVTPVKSAVAMSKIFEGSRVLERDAFGHGSIAQPSDCTTGVLRGYFSSEMVLPEDQKVCEVDFGVFDLGEFP
ncbi:hypothetical protein QBC40DRAFT_271036 [Triangularia verruculosa]|uniref:Peptidase S33 tripeptidyl aminopeptidase-like C-terminal domain-containing protein n=1 Tax=Triangularia verruculosa TaxID=2587418 RepID=A0AAN6XRE9_9PEZI|nr:hypothetical protein QBC40DRAFT_271036 [Triangularia verruculosa]